MLVSVASAYWSYAVGDELELDDELANTWDTVGHCKILSSESEDPELTEEDLELGEELINLGGGWYELPDGQKIKGKTAALEALKVTAEISEGSEEDADKSE